LRANLPEPTFLGLKVTSFKDEFPLRCKTQVIEVDKGDLKEIDDIIGRTMAECWALWSNGDVSAFPSVVYSLNELSGTRSVCVPCARIHLTVDAKNKLGGNIDIRRALDSPMTNEYSYFTYLEESGKQFPAFNPASSRKFDLNGSSFLVDESEKEPITLKNLLTGGEESGIEIKSSKVSLPKFFYLDKGDLIINYGVALSSTEGPIGDYIPYLFYFQNGQDPDPFGQTKNLLIDGPAWKNYHLCETWEGIPA
jgi:hypothetical protein